MCGACADARGSEERDPLSTPRNVSGSALSRTSESA